MSHMAYSNHIAITSRDKSTTRSKVSVVSYPVCPIDRNHVIEITLRNSIHTERRNSLNPKFRPPLLAT